MKQLITLRVSSLGVCLKTKPEADSPNDCEALGSEYCFKKKVLQKVSLFSDTHG